MPTVNWKAAVPGNWTDAAKWDIGVPTSADDVNISIAGIYTVSLIASVQSANSITISDPAATFAIDATGSGGATLSLGGGMTNGGDVIIGNSAITSATTLAGASLNNTGTIEMTGGSAAAVINISGSIGNSGGLTLSGNATLNSGSFLNSGVLSINVGAGDTGGAVASLGALTNSGDLDIGNSALTTAVTANASSLSNSLSGTLHLTGGSAQAALKINSAAPTTWSGAIFLEGNSLLQFASGGISTIAANSEISLDGSQARLATAAQPGSNSALKTLTKNLGFFNLEHGAKVTTNGNLANSGTLGVDSGSLLTVGGTLTNTGAFSVGHSILSQPTMVTAAGFVNTGSLSVNGLSARATLNILGAAPTTLTGSWNLGGDALVQFGSGGITKIGNNGSLFLDGTRAHLQLAADPTNNSALAKLATNSGNLNVLNGAAISTSGDFTNTGSTSVDGFFGIGGSSVTVAGTLTNKGSVSIGNNNILAATNLNAAALVNTGNVSLTGSPTAQAMMAIAGVAPSSLAGSFNLTGNAVLQFGSGAITAIGSGSSLRLDGADALVALSSAPGSNSALTTLGSNVGTFTLANGSVLATTVDFANKSSLGVDSSFLNTGGSSVTLGGTLTNSGAVSIGNSNIAAATTVNAAALVNAGSLTLSGGAANATLNITGDASNSSFGFNIDSNFFGGGGGGIFSVGGTLTNTGMMTIGNLGLTKATTVTAGALVNVTGGGTAGVNGTINLAGGTALASFNVGSAAPSTLIGNFNLDGNALLKFASGAITAISEGSSLSLDGALSRVAVGAATGTNSALTKLASNAGKFDLADGAKVSTTVGFTNGSGVSVDSSGFGGSSFTVGGTLTNGGFLQIGNSNLTAATTVKAAALNNTGSLNVTDGAASVTLNITGDVNNSGFNFNIDSFGGFGGSGGGIFTVGGTLSNSGFMTIGNTGLTRATSASAALLANTGTLNLAGGTAQASLTIAGAAPSSTLGGDFNLTGNALLQFGSGAITAIDNNGAVRLDGAAALIALSATPGSNSALTTLASNAGTFSLRNGAKVSTTVGFTNSGITGVDTFGVGGSRFKVVGATLTNSGVLDIGNSGITAASQVTAKNLINTGSVNLTGGAAQASLIIFGAAPSTLTGDYDLDGNALLQFNSGAITALADFASLTLDGALSRVALAATPGSNSALTKLATNDGAFTLLDGATVSTTVGLTNEGSVSVDSFGVGGSSFTVGGTLNNRGFTSIGNNNLTAATTVDVAALINTSGLSLTGGVASATLNITGDANNSSLFSFNIDSTNFFGGSGGAIFTAGGTLTNSGTITIGNIGLTRATSASAAALANTGTLNIAGGTAQASLTIAGAAPSTTLGGDFNLTGNALLKFGSGAIAAIGSGGGLRLDGAVALIALSATPGSNSALTTLGSNAGTFSLADGAQLSTSVGFSNTNTVSIDGGVNNAGGSTFSVGGTLNNSGFQFNVGNSGIIAATTVTAAALANSGSITLTGGAAQAKMAIAGAAPSTLTGSFSLNGDALLTFGSGAITAIGSVFNFGGSLSLSGAAAHVARSAAPGSNSALTKLASNFGSFNLINGAALTTTVGFANTNSLSVDTGGGASTFTVGGTLNNTGSVSIGNSNLTAATTVNAAALGNNGSLHLTGGTASATLNITGNASNSGFSFGIDSFGGFGGSGGGVLTVGARLTNSGFMTIGNTGLIRATSASAAALTNTGTLNIVGGTAEDGGTARASLTIASAAPATTSTGNFNLTGNALLQFSSGAITTIGSGGGLSLDGAGAYIALAATPGSNSALTKLASNAGSFNLANGAKLSTTISLSNTNFVGVDDSGAGGSGFTIVGGTLTNGGTLDVGNPFITSASQVTAKNLANTGTINITGGAAPASLVINSAAPGTLTGQVNLTGDALLRYASGAITAIGSGLFTGLSLDGAAARVALAATPGSNSALTTLGSNAGNLDLENGASLTTTVAFSNTDTLEVDIGFLNGGSSLNLGGNLTNSGFVQIGNSALIGATTVTATGLTNSTFSSQIAVFGNAVGDKATLTLTGASSNAGTIVISSGGVLALGGALTVTGTLDFTGGTISGGTLAGAGTISDNFGASRLDGVTIDASTTVGVSVGALLLNSVTVNGAISGDGLSTLAFAQPGTDAMTNISGFSTINLADGGANSLNLTDANFTNVGGNIITVNGGDSGNTIDASGLTAPHAIVFNAGPGTDTATGGAGDDVFFAGGNTTMTGGAGAGQLNKFTFSDIGANHITDFALGGNNELVLRDSGFDLGSQDGQGTGTPQHLAAGVFVNGAFTTTAQRFAYNQANGTLSYDRDGSGGAFTASPVVILNDLASLTAGAAGNVFFTA